MKATNMRTLWVGSLALTLLGARSACAWGNDGHRVIAAVAMQGLNPRAKAAAADLVPNGDLVQVATWADDLRARQRHDFLSSGARYILSDPDATEFLRHDPGSPAHSPQQPAWHYAETPVGATRWAKSEADDVVTTIRRCERVLSAATPPTGEFITRRQAVRFLVHLVGDVHQPLHAVNGYWDYHAQLPVLLRPASLAQVPPGALNDRGGNQLYYTATLTYHHLWDTPLVKLVAGQKESDREPVSLDPASGFMQDLLRRSGGPAKQWTLEPGDGAEAWANHSLEIAGRIYDGLPASGLVKSRHGRDAAHQSDAIDLPRGFVGRAYKQAQMDTVRDQLAAAGYHLAGLLNKIWPEQGRR